MKFFVLPPYNALTTHYSGNYEDMVETYDKLFKEIGNLDKKFKGITYE
ncbi:hypothetical protein ALNOE001_02880 [Candidatus Methanobinarius endosymbioticus]|uniref:Uncharacterized protein n=1 Tax=Candidatus Methanobinarius endosymbioticus TaxID=2006182 RepID=A0A366MFA9_9EURY|nr:hypothetical protein ALNOE001_02880 [Candidatus Methanobinarius endosymbioticus]